MLRNQSNDVAVRVTAKTMENDEREERLQSNSATVELARERLDRMRQCLLMQSNSNVDGSSNNSEDGTRIDEGRQYQGVGGGLKDALVSGTQQIQTLRFHYACKVFDMHHLDVGEQYSKQVTNTKESDKSMISGEMLLMWRMIMMGAMMMKSILDIRNNTIYAVLVVMMDCR